MNSFNNISTNDELAHFLGIPLTKLNYIIFVRGIDQYYKTFDVPKKNGEPRHICASTGALKTLQHKLSNELWVHQKAVNDRLKRTPNISHAFERGKNIITNAKIHRYAATKHTKYTRYRMYIMYKKAMERIAAAGTTYHSPAATLSDAPAPRSAAAGSSAPLPAPRTVSGSRRG